MLANMRLSMKFGLLMALPVVALLVTAVNGYRDFGASSATFIVSFVGIVLTIALGFAVSRSVKRSLVEAAAATRGVAAGNFHGFANAAVSDETGQLLGALNELAHQLQSRGSDHESVVAERDRLHETLQGMSVPVTVVNEANEVVFVNPAATHFLQGIEADWRAETPSFSARAIDGAKLPGLFRDPALNGVFSTNRQSERVAEGDVGERHLRLMVAPLRDSRGNVHGQVVQWFDRTDSVRKARATEEALVDERRAAEENKRIRIALDHVNTNVMLADKDRRIIYLNHAAQALFGGAEQEFRSELPGFSADDLVGTSIDKFHKNPQHQMQMLDRLTGTHTAEIALAGRTLKITANPVVDATGERLGTAVEWEDRTVEAEVEREVENLVKAAQDGDLEHRIKLEGKDGFFRQLGVGFNALLDQLSGVFDEIANVMGKMASGDLSASIETEYRGKFGQVRNDINETTEKLGQIIGRLDSIAADISTASGEISSGNTNLSSRTEQQASSLEETASSMEELTSTVRNNADNAQQANQVATSARSAAERGGEVVSNAIAAMDQINSSSNKIAEIIGVIDEIAFQTNLLALNASVEAARAGEQGRGFAVVATEVRNLASRSATAAKEIKDLIRDSVAKVEAGSALVNESGTTLDEIVVGVKKVGDIVAEIAAASAEQSNGIEQVNQAITSMDELTQQNAALAEQTSAASAAMTENTEEMRGLMAFFHGAGTTSSSMPTPVAKPKAANAAPAAKPSAAPKAEAVAKPAAPAKPAPKPAVSTAKPEKAAAPKPAASTAEAKPKAAAPKPTVERAAPAARKPAPKVAAQSFDDDEWEEF